MVLEFVLDDVEENDWFNTLQEEGQAIMKTGYNDIHC